MQYCVELSYQVDGAAEFLINVHATKTRRQTVVEESVSIEPTLEPRLDIDAVTGTRFLTFPAVAGNTFVGYTALVDHRTRGFNR